MIGSAAIDAGPSIASTTYDQRGAPFVRLYNGNLDIGAFEAQPMLTNTLDDGSIGSLRWAIILANSISSGAVIISFGPTVFNIQQTIALGSILSITKSDITINGPGASLLTISGMNAVQVFSISSGVMKVVLTGLTIAHATSPFYTNGGCIQNNGQLSFTGCVISQCTASVSNGGGIYNSGTLVVDLCTFSGNKATYIGGAIYSSYSASLTVSRSTFTANSASNGDAICIEQTSVATISDSTFYGNGKLGSGRAAISGRGTASIQRCTITANYGDAGTAGGLHIYGETTTIESNIIYGNLGTGRDILAMARIVDNGHNIIGIWSGFTPAPTTLSVDPLLAPLANNGGPTQTYALLPGSPAIDAGPNTASTIYDQRAAPFVRLYNGNLDIGAFAGQPLIVTNNLDDGSVGSLRWAITLANSISLVSVIITFDMSVFSAAKTITLASALPTITKSDLTITGPGANLVTISGNNAVQVFLINSGVTNVAMSGLTITAGTFQEGGGCFQPRPTKHHGLCYISLHSKCDFRCWWRHLQFRNSGG